MKRLTIIAALLLIAACAKREAPATDTSAAAPAAAATNADTKAANVSDAIAANPAKADSILSANGYTKESFEAEMFAIAADSARSAAYAAAKKQ